MTKEFLQKLVDGVFDFIEAQLPNRPLLKLALEEVRHIIDTQGIDALFAFLQNKGIV